MVERVEAVAASMSGLAHDLRNLFGMMRNLRNLMLEDHNAGDDTLYRTRSEALFALIKHGEELADNLAVFTLQSPLRLEIFDMSEIVERALTATFSPMAGVSERFEKRILVERAYADDLWLVKADHIQIERVLLNLLLNAGDAMAEGGTLTIRTFNSLRTEPFAACVVVEVSDTGVGMTEYEREHCFDPAYTTKTNGMGLGLAQAYMVARNAGGTVSVSSEKLRGTTFRLSLPAGFSASGASRPALTREAVSS